MAERFKAALLKSAIPKGIVSSNLTLSATVSSYDSVCKIARFSVYFSGRIAGDGVARPTMVACHLSSAGRAVLS